MPAPIEAPPEDVAPVDILPLPVEDPIELVPERDPRELFDLEPLLVPVALLPELVDDIEPDPVLPIAPLPMLPLLIDPLPVLPPVLPIEPEPIELPLMPPEVDAPVAPAEPDPPAAPEAPAPPPAAPPPPPACAITATGLSATMAAANKNFRMILSCYVCAGLTILDAGSSCRAPLPSTRIACPKCAARL